MTTKSHTYSIAQPSPRSSFAHLLRGDTPESLASARRAIRAQIGSLEKKLSAVACALEEPVVASGPAAGPRLLDLEQLERVRDRLVDCLTVAQHRLGAQEQRRAEARAELERMLAAPSDFRFARISRAQLGLSGCGDYAVRPRLGLLGMLAGWWEVKLSSGCP